MPLELITEDAELVAQDAETLVREVLNAQLAARGINSIARFPEAVASSYLPRGRGTGWTDPHPLKVLVFIEYSIGDPMHHDDVREAFDDTAREIAGHYAFTDAGWESVNPAVQYFWMHAR